MKVRERTSQENRVATLEAFTKEVDDKNSSVESYRALIPIAKPLILKYAEYFNGATINWNYIELTPVDENKLPPMFFCEALESGVLAKVKTHSGGGFGGYYSVKVVLVLNKC